MATTRQDLARLGQRELDIMEALWTLESGTVSEVHDELGESIDVAYTTVQTMLNRLEAKGFVTREREGRAYRYRPRLEQPVATGKAIESLVSRFFSGSTEALAKHLVERDLSTEELDRIQALIDAQRREGQKKV